MPSAPSCSPAICAPANGPAPPVCHLAKSSPSSPARRAQSRRKPCRSWPTPRAARRKICCASKEKGGPFGPPFSKLSDNGSEGDPDAAAVIAAALMVVAPVTVTIPLPVAMEIPVVGVIIEPDARGVIARFGVPAVALAIADDIGGSRCSQGHQRSRADNGAKNKGLNFHQNDLHQIWVSAPLFEKRTWRSSVPTFMNSP